jgi:hypothetical protein
MQIVKYVRKIFVSDHKEIYHLEHLALFRQYY